MRCRLPTCAAALLFCLALAPVARADPKRSPECDGDHDDAKGDRYWRCLAQKLAAQLDAANAALSTCNGSLSTCNGSLSTCNGSLSTCNGSLSTCNGSLSTCNATLTGCASSLATCNGQVQSCQAELSAPLPRSCAEIHASHPDLPDGVYNIQPDGVGPLQVHCLMSADGGGWTLVSNFPWNGTTSGTPGWNSGNQIGANLTDLTHAFKLSDGLINQLKTSTYRAHGTATHCLVPNVGDPAACQVDTTLFWSAACTYASGTRNPHCGEPFLDAALTMRDPTGANDASPCAWHWGLVAAICQVTSEMGTSHVGDHEFVGRTDGSFIHSFDGRTGEDPSIQVWVR